MSGAMSCHEVRELFSAVLDGALAAADRSKLDAHLAGCPDCRHELERFERAVRLLQSLEPARAPVGFVDRVLTAARPTPWYRRALRRAFVPFRVKLPLEAAAVVIVAIVGVYVFRGTPELQRAASPDYAPSTSESRRAVADKAAPPPSAPPVASRRKEPSEEPLARERVRERDEAERPPSVAGGAPAENRQSEEFRSPRSLPPTTKEEEKAARVQPMAKPSAAARAPTPPEVAGRLSAPDRDAATRGIADLILRLGATEVTRRVEPNATFVEVLVPYSAYAEFLAGLARLGHWMPEREATELPAQIRIALRITD